MTLVAASKQVRLSLNQGITLVEPPMFSELSEWSVLGITVPLARLLPNKKREQMFDECVLGVRANVFTTNELKGEGYQKEQSGLSTTGGHSVRAVVYVHVVNSER